MHAETAIIRTDDNIPHPVDIPHYKIYMNAIYYKPASAVHPISPFPFPGYEVTSMRIIQSASCCIQSIIIENIIIDSDIYIRTFTCNPRSTGATKHYAA